MPIKDWFILKLNTAIEMLMSGKTTKDECACYLMDFRKSLVGIDEVIVDEEKRRNWRLSLENKHIK